MRSLLSESGGVTPVSLVMKKHAVVKKKGVKKKHH